MNKPKFITFTGADDSTSIEGMCELSARYPIEWGILFSPKRQGEGRYPSIDFVRRLTRPGLHDLQLSAHICGGYSRALLEYGRTGLEEPIRAHFQRVQVNTSDPSIDTGEIFEWADALKVRAIVQCREVFPSDLLVDWLFDASGGRGISPASWPKPLPGALAGYAGGLNPSNAANAVSIIGSMTNNYWIDMETGVRDENDCFSLDKCRQVCESVYGAAPTPPAGELERGKMTGQEGE